jgi:hypothetical protein
LAGKLVELAVEQERNPAERIAFIRNALVLAEFLAREGRVPRSDQARS